MVPKIGHITTTKIENLHIDTRSKKKTDSKIAILFDLRRKITKLLRLTVSEQCCHQVLGHLELTLVVNTSF